MVEWGYSEEGEAEEEEGEAEEEEDALIKRGAVRVQDKEKCIVEERGGGGGKY